jgi:integrase/recombinase XerD
MADDSRSRYLVYVIEAASSERDQLCWYAERNRIILKLLYILGLRVSGLVGLNWSDFKPTSDSITVTVFGKGHKARTLLIGNQLWSELQ